MATQSPIRRYAVVQEKEWVENEIVAAIKAHRNVELDLINESGVQHVSFRVHSTEHDDQGSLFIGIMPDHHTINIRIVKDGEVFALLSN